MISAIKAGGRLVVAFSFVISTVDAIAASSALSFTAHSLNRNPGDSVTLLAVDAQGDAYVAGSVTDSSGISWAQVTKTNPTGQMVASYRFQQGESVAALQIDPYGAVIVAGVGYAADLPTAHVYGPATSSPVAFVVKLDSGLHGITAAAVIGGNQENQEYLGQPGDVPLHTMPSAAAVDSAGNIYLGGWTTASDFPVTAGAYETTPDSGFLVELSNGLDRLVFATYYDLVMTSLAVDGAGSMVGATNYEYTVGSLFTEQLMWTGTIVKFAPNAGSVLWTEALAEVGEGSAVITSLAVDTSGDVVVVGTPVAGVPDDTGQAVPALHATFAARASASTAQSCSVGAGFVAKLAGASGATEFLTYYDCAVNAVAVDTSGTIWITGVTYAHSYLAALAADGTSVLASYTAAATSNTETYYGTVGIFGQALALTLTGTPVVLGSEGFLMLANSAGGPSLLGGVANSAGGGWAGLVAPLELVSFYGSSLGPATPIAAQVLNGVMPSYLGGYQLLFDGVAAPLLYIGANQINAIVPSEAAGQDSVSITLVTPAGTFPLADLYIRPSEPGIFCDPTSLYAAAINQDGTVNSATNPAHAGQLVSIWGTGAGGTALYGELPSNGEPGLPVSIIAGYELAEGEYAAGESLEVDYAGNAPGEFAGVLQINFRIPQTLTSKVASSGSLYVSLQVGAAGSLFVPIHVAP